MSSLQQQPRNVSNPPAILKNRSGSNLNIYSRPHSSKKQGVRFQDQGGEGAPRTTNMHDEDRYEIPETQQNIDDASTASEEEDGEQIEEEEEQDQDLFLSTQVNQDQKNNDVPQGRQSKRDKPTNVTAIQLEKVKQEAQLVNHAYEFLESSQPESLAANHLQQPITTTTTTLNRDELEYAEEKEIPPLPDTQNEVGLIKNDDDLMAFIYEDDFVLRTWGLVNERKTHETIKSRLMAKHGAMYNHVISFLRGETITLTSAQMISFLQHEPHTAIEESPIAILLFQFVTSNLDIQEIFPFYEKLLALEAQLPTSFLAIVLNVGYFKVQQKLLSDKGDEENYDEDEDALLAMIPTHLRTTTQNIYYMLYEDHQHFGNEITAALTQTILEASYDHRVGDSEEHHQAKNKSSMWLKLVTRLIPNYLNQTTASNIFEMLLLNNQESMIGTVKYADVITNRGVSKPLHLHQAVVERFGGSRITTSNHINTNNSQDDADKSDNVNNIVIKASTQDMKTIMNLLYLQSEQDLNNGKLTMGVFRIASQLGIRKNLSWFLLRGNSFVTLTNNYNKMEVLQILVKLRERRLLEEATHALHLAFYPDEQLQMLIALKPEEIKFLFALQSFQKFCELQKYLMLESWAKAEAAKDLHVTNLLMENQFHKSKAKAKFALIRDCVHVGRLARASYGNFKKIQLIEIRDILRPSPGKAIKMFKSIKN